MSTSTTTAGHAPSTAAERGACAVSVLVKVAALYYVNSEPGWRGLRFFTEDAAPLMELLSLALAVTVLASLAGIAAASQWIKPAARLVAGAVWTVLIVLAWREFPLDLQDGSLWEWIVRAALVMGLALFLWSAQGAARELVRRAAQRRSMCG